MKTYLLPLITTTLLIVPAYAHYAYTAGHGDIGLGENGMLELHLHFHEGAFVNGAALIDEAEFDPGRVVIIVPDATRFDRSADAIWDFLGNGPGDATWVLPQSRSDADIFDAPYLGIGADHVSTGVFADNRLTLTLIDVDGPGWFSLYRTSLTVLQVFMTSSDGISAADTIEVEAGRHRHFNFAFSAPGEYRITFMASAVHLENGPVTDQATFVFHVIPEPATVSLLLLGIMGLKYRK